MIAMRAIQDTRGHLETQGEGIKRQVVEAFKMLFRNILRLFKHTNVVFLIIYTIFNKRSIGCYKSKLILFVI